MTDILKRFEAVCLDVSEFSIDDLIREAYAGSKPVGMGMLHYRPGPLDDQTLEGIKSNAHTSSDGVTAIHTDCVHGRQMKFSVYSIGDKKFTYKTWYDHTSYDLTDMIRRLKALNHAKTPA